MVPMRRRLKQPVTSDVGRATSTWNATIHTESDISMCHAPNSASERDLSEVGFRRIFIQTRKSTNLRDPTSKKTRQPQTETRFTWGRFKKRVNSRQAYPPQIDPSKMILGLTALIEEQWRIYSNFHLEVFQASGIGSDTSEPSEEGRRICEIRGPRQHNQMTLRD